MLSFAILPTLCAPYALSKAYKSVGPRMQSRGARAARQIAQQIAKAKDRNLRSAWELIVFGDGPKVSRPQARTVTMPEPEKDVEPPDNVLRLGTESMVAIAEELRRMYASFLRQEPPERIARLMRQIERGEDIS